MKTTWKDIPGFKGLYQASNTGLIKSFKRSGSAGRILKPGIRRGYQSVTLCKGNKKFPSNVHRLIAFTFLSKVKDNNVVNHKDGNKLNNNYENLEWVTRKQNQDHAYIVLGENNKGEKNGRSKLTKREVEFIRYIKKICPKLKGKQVSDFYKMADVSIFDIWNNKKWK